MSITDSNLTDNKYNRPHTYYDSKYNIYVIKYN